MSNCAPETVASGLEKMPLPYVYKNSGADTDQKATGKLPTGETLQGGDTYKSLMRFFTTFDITPEQLRKETQERLNKLYPQVIFKSLVHNSISLATSNRLLQVTAVRSGTEKCRYFKGRQVKPAFR